ncbi:MAG: 50S ribosomal protein L24 [Candidatus Altiarchaeota archaeon]
MKKPSSKKPGKQRKWNAKAPLHSRRKMTASHLTAELIGKYKRRKIPIRKGDAVVVLRGEFKGVTGEVVRVETSSGRVYLEGLTVKKADGTDVERPVHASNVKITELYLEDRERREVLERKIGKPVEDGSQ